MGRQVSTEQFGRGAYNKQSTTGEVGDYRSQAIKAAEDFHYGYKVIEQLENAKTEAQISNIMRAARHEKFGR